MNRLLYVPVARLTFDQEAAASVFEESLQELKKIERNLIYPDHPLTSVEDMKEYLVQNKHKVGGVIFQHITFTDGEFIKTIMEESNLAILYWGVREPGIGGRLKLNSLTGVMSTANVLYNHQKQSFYMIGNAADPMFQKEMKRKIRLLKFVIQCSALQFGVIGELPSGFYFSGTNESKLKQTFGVSLHHYELEHLFEKAKDVPEEEYREEMKYALSRLSNYNQEEENVIKLAQFITCVKKLINQDHLQALASRCWPDFFTELKVAPCGIFSQLTDQGYPVGCEADIHGSLSMYMMQTLTGNSAPYMGDVVHFMEDQNAIILWHCGFAPYSLAKDQKATAGVHPNRKMGLAMDFGLKEGKVTLFRIGDGPQGYRFIVVSGSVLKEGNAYQGTSAVVKLDHDVTNFIHDSVKLGFEPHFAMIYGDVTKELEELATYYHVTLHMYQ